MPSQQQDEEKQHDKIEFIGMDDDDDDVINMIDNHTLNEDNKLLILISSLSTNNHQYSAQQRIQNLFSSKNIQFETLDGAQPENKMMRNKLFAISNIRGKYPQIFITSNIKQKDIKTPLIPQKPQKNARAYFTGLHVGDIFIDNQTSIACTVDKYSDIVGAGCYKKNSEAFPNAVNASFDGIAIDANTRVIIWEKPNFEGNILLDQVGPALINNCLYKDYAFLQEIMTKTFMDVELQRTFPPDRRYWSTSNMNSWYNGSVKVVGALIPQKEEKEQKNEKQQHQIEQKQNINTEKKVDAENIDYDVMLHELNMTAPIIHECTGQCGTEFSSLVQYAINANIQQMENYQDIVQDAFYDNKRPLRIALVELMKEIGCYTKYSIQYTKLKDTTYVLDCEDEIEEISELLSNFVKDGFKNILQELANKSCKISSRNLIEEMIGNNGWKSTIIECNDNNNNSQNGSGDDVNKESENAENNNFDDGKNSGDGDDEKNNDDNKNDGDDGDDDPNKYSLPSTVDDIKYFLWRLLTVKKHPNYKVMVEKGYKLSDFELIAIIYYCDSSTSCYSMKQYHRGLERNCKWRNLYYHVTNAIDKLHQCFHFKNKEREEYKTLFHGSRCNKLDIYSQEQLFLKTITSFTWDIGTARDFAQSGTNGDGLILAVDKAGRSIFNGTLRAADVSWISIHNEKEYIILASTFHHFKILTEKQVLNRNWIVAPEKNKIYITKQYKSNQDIRCIHSDNIKNKIIPSYIDIPKEFDSKTMEMLNQICLENTDNISHSQHVFIDIEKFEDKDTSKMRESVHDKMHCIGKIWDLIYSLRSMIYRAGFDMEISIKKSKKRRDEAMNNYSNDMCETLNLVFGILQNKYKDTADVLQPYRDKINDFFISQQINQRIFVRMKRKNFQTELRSFIGVDNKLNGPIMRLHTIINEMLCQTVYNV